MGKYEDQLAQLAALERWVLPGLDSLHLALNEVKISYDRVHGDTGFTGKTDAAIKEMLSLQATEAANNADALSELPRQIEAANAALALAKQAHSKLPDAEIEPELKQNILAGSWLAFPLGTLAGHEGVRLWEEHLAGEREKAAKEALDAFEADISTPTSKTTEHALNANKPSDGNYHAAEAQNRPPFTPIPTGGPTTPGPRTTPSSVGRGGGGGEDPRTEVFPPPPPRPPVEPPVITDPGTDIPGGTDDPVVSDPGGTGPGGTGPGGSGPGTTAPSVDGGLDGSIAGAGGLAGAAGLAGGARLAGRLGAGAGGLGAGIPGMGGVGGLGAGGLGAGGLGAGGLGANGAASTMGAGSGSGSAAGGRGSGTSAGGRGGQSMMSHGQGQGGGESDRKKKRPSGLLGLAAPTLDDDGDPTLRSASAGPGARGGRSGRNADDSAVGYDDGAPGE